MYIKFEFNKELGISDSKDIEVQQKYKQRERKIKFFLFVFLIIEELLERISTKEIKYNVTVNKSMMTEGYVNKEVVDIQELILEIFFKEL